MFDLSKFTEISSISFIFKTCTQIEDRFFYLIGFFNTISPSLIKDNILA
jgi:hypothetical protein